VQKPATTAAVQQRDIEAYWKQRNAALGSTGSQNVITQAAALRDGAAHEGVREAFSLVAKKNEELGHTFSHVKVSGVQIRINLRSILELNAIRPGALPCVLHICVCLASHHASSNATLSLKLVLDQVDPLQRIKGKEKLQSSQNNN
jgi:hypothetical protein